MLDTEIFWCAQLVASCGINTFDNSICKGDSMFSVYTIPKNGYSLIPKKIRAVEPDLFLTLLTLAPAFARRGPGYYRLRLLV